MSTATKQPAKQQKGKGSAKANILESFRDIAGGTVDSATHNLFSEIPKDFTRQFLGMPERSVSGELIPGETLEMQEAMSGELEKRKRLEQKLVLERKLRQEEQTRSLKKQQELKLQLSALVSEVFRLAQATQGLSRETQIATLQAPAQPGIYHLVFFEKLLEFIRSFRKKIENASVWMAAYNNRAKKRAHTFWGQVGVGGAKRLLSGEDYSQRAAA